MKRSTQLSLRLTVNRLTKELAEARSLYEQACQAEDAVLAANKENHQLAEKWERIADGLRALLEQEGYRDNIAAKPRAIVQYEKMKDSTKS